MNGDERMKYIKITRPDINGKLSYCVEPYKIGKFIQDEFEDAEIGERIILEFIEMDEDEYIELPEFEGW